MRLFFLAAIAFAVCASASAQVAVYVDSNTKDSIGKRLDFVVRDHIRSSSSFRITYDEEEAIIKVSLNTLDPDRDTRSVSTRTVYAFNILLRNPSGGFDYLVKSFVGYCGTDVLASCGDDISQEIGVVIEDLRKVVNAKTVNAKPFDSPP